MYQIKCELVTSQYDLLIYRKDLKVVYASNSYHSTSDTVLVRYKIIRFTVVYVI